MITGEEQSYSVGCIFGVQEGLNGYYGALVGRTAVIWRVHGVYGHPGDVEGLLGVSGWYCMVPWGLGWKVHIERVVCLVLGVSW